MKCPYCGEENDKSSKFCSRCGKRLILQNIDNEEYPDENYGFFTQGDPRIDTVEVPIDYIDSSYKSDISRFGIAGFSSLLTDKRIYLSGKIYTGGLSNAQKRRTEKVVNLEDVTGSGFVTYSNIRYIIAAIITFFIACVFLLFGTMRSVYTNDFISPGAITMGVILIIASVILIVAFFATRVTCYFIEYAGGSIAFGTAEVGDKIKKFHINLRRAIDKRKNAYIAGTL